MKKPPRGEPGRLLFLEERIARVRQALNERTLPLTEDAPQRAALNALIRECLTTLDGLGPEWGGLKE